jgi:hypothetical protein
MNLGHEWRRSLQVVGGALQPAEPGCRIVTLKIRKHPGNTGGSLKPGPHSGNNRRSVLYRNCISAEHTPSSGPAVRIALRRGQMATEVSLVCVVLPGYLRVFPRGLQSIQHCLTVSQP